MLLFFFNWIDGWFIVVKMKVIFGEMVDGYLSEFSLVVEDVFIRMFDDYSYVGVVILLCVVVIVWCVFVVEGNIKMGDKVLIEGLGGMFIFVL